MNEILGQIGEAFVLLRADGSKLSDDMKKEKDKLEKDLQQWGGRLKGVGGALSVGVTAPILAIGAAAITAGYQIDEAFDNIRIGTGATGRALDDLQLSFKNVFKDVPSSANDVSVAIADLNTKTGATGPHLEQLARQSLNLSRITKTDLAANIDFAAKTFASWQIPTDKQSAALDHLFKVSQSTGIGVTDLMQKVNEFGPIMREFGFTFEESAAAFGQWSKAGLNAEQMLSSLRIAAKRFAEAGVPMQEGLEKTLKTIKDLGPGTESANLAIKIFGRSGLLVAEAIHKGKLSVEDFVEELRKSPETINKATEETDGFAEGLQRLRNQATLALEPLGTRLLAMGEKILPFLIKAGELAIGVAEAFGKLPTPIQEVIVIFGAVAAAAGPVIYAVGALIGSLTTIAGTFGTAGAAATVATGTITSMGLAATATSIALGAIGIAIAGWALYKIAQAGSLIWDLRNQSVQAAKDMEYAQTQAQRNIQLAYEKTGQKVKDITEANKVLNAYSAGLRGEQMKGVAVTLQQAQAWARGAEDAKKKGAAVQNLSKDTKAQAQSEGNLKIATDATATAQANALLKQLGLNDGKKAGKTAADEYAESLKRLNAQLGGEEVTKNAKLYLDVLNNTGKIAGLTKGELEQAAAALLAFIEKMEKSGKTTTAQFQAAKAAYADVMAELRKTDIDERIKAISKAFSGEELKANAEAYIGYLQKIGTTTGLTREETNLIVAELEKYLDRLRELGKTTTEEFAKVAAARDALLLPSSNPISIGGIDLTKIPLPGAGMINQKVSEAVYKMGGKVVDFFKKGVLGGMKPGEFGGKIGDLILGAFQGGGDVGKTIGGMIGGNVGKYLTGGITKVLGGAAGKVFGATAGKFIGGALGSVIPGIGTFLGGMLGDFIGKGLGKVGGWIAGGFKKLFGGPSEKELAGRAARDQVGLALTQNISDANRKEVQAGLAESDHWKGNEQGLAEAVVLKNAFMAAGYDARLGLDYADKLHAATGKGPDQVKRVVEEIKSLLGRFTPQGLLQLREGGWGDFGKGSMAMLHGRELVLPERKLEQMQKNSMAAFTILADRMSMERGMFGNRFAAIIERLLSSSNMARSGVGSVVNERVASVIKLKAQDPGESILKRLMEHGALGNKINFAPTFKGTLDHEMKGLIRSRLWPQFLDVLRESQKLRDEAAAVINNETV